jgi:uncharacterized protein (DUF1778 family)
MTNEELLRRGNAAQELLNNEAFRLVTKDLLDYYIGAVLQSAPDDLKGRESAYFSSRALQDLIAVLNQWVVIKEQIISNTEEN